MGCCPSDEQTKKNKELQKELNDARRKDSAVKKLLFLGSGGSGKSTLFKQLRSLHGAGYGDKDRLQFKDHIYAQIVEQMKLCIECINDANEEDYGDEDQKDPLKLSEEGKQAEYVLNNTTGASAKFTDTLCDAVEKLWAEDAVRTIFKERALYKIEDSSEYFWNHVRRVAAPDYVPNDEDILLVRYRTTGVIEQKFEIKKNLFHVFDVGGQKSERKKWIHCFESVTAVIFVASLSCYDEVMFEDQEKNSMVDQLELFANIVNEPTFEKTSVILFLNKKDLFAERLARGQPITLCPAFESYSGGATDVEDTTNYIKAAFVAKNRNPDESSIFTHLTCATDVSNVEKVFNDVQHIIIENSLMSAGLMGDFGGDGDDDEEQLQGS